MKITEHNGIISTEFNSVNEENAVCCINDKRIILRAKPKIRVCKNQYKFGDELEIGVFVHKNNLIKEEIRNKSNWNSISIYFKLEEGKRIIKELHKFLLKKEIKNETKKTEKTSESC